MDGGPDGTDRSGDLGRLAAELVRQVSRWSERGWRSAAGGSTRADVTHAAVQRLADLAAIAEGRPGRPVPRLDRDVALSDQLAVTAEDLRRTGSATTATAGFAELTRLRRALGMR